MHVHTNILVGLGGGGGWVWTVICQNMQTECSNLCPCMYNIEQKHTFEYNIVLTKMTPFIIPFGVKRPLNTIYSFGQKPTMQFTVLPKLF